MPIYDPPQKSTQKPEFYVKLEEAKTTIQFDTLNKIKKFSSPGCNKTQTVAFWTNSIKIECYSNDAKTVNLKINLLTSKFEKTYSKNNQKIHSLTGFCLTGNN